MVDKIGHSPSFQSKLIVRDSYLKTFVKEGQEVIKPVRRDMRFTPSLKQDESVRATINAFRLKENGLNELSSNNVEDLIGVLRPIFSELKQVTKAGKPLLRKRKASKAALTRIKKRRYQKRSDLLKKLSSVRYVSKSQKSIILSDKPNGEPLFRFEF